MSALLEAIAALPEEDQQSLAAWLSLQTMDEWDRQMQGDFSPGGKGTQFREQVKREIAQGPVRPIERRVCETARPALVKLDGNRFTWVWIGTHDEYERIIG